MLQWFFLPTMVKDFERYARECPKCQMLAPIHHVLSNELISISSLWSFIQWGMDIVMHLPQALRQKKFILVATDYFSKWVDAEAYANVKDSDVVNFIWKTIVTRFGLPSIIVIDNGSQFIS